jgi:death-on-curing protein
VFIDGNKRSSIALGAYFLKLNGYDYSIKKFVREMENIVVWVAEGKIEKDLLCNLIESLIYEDDYNESLKLSLAIAISDDWNQS